MALLSYSCAVLTDPGSLDSPRRNWSKCHDYSYLPTTEPSDDSFVLSSITAGSEEGQGSYCRRCQNIRPDRAHHCSSCKRCVLKMDHHCPWLATCIGMFNYKFFVLFLVYVSLFCYACFAISLHYIFNEVIDRLEQLDEVDAPISVFLLVVLSGILGIVLTAFTGWHLSLVFRNLTTIENLEEPRYVSPLRERLERQKKKAQHGRSVRGSPSPGSSRTDADSKSGNPSLSTRSTPRHVPLEQAAGYVNGQPSPLRGLYYQKFIEKERARERERYEEYLDEQESKNLPNPFDQGWKWNFQHVFGPNPWLWWFPVANSIGDGWQWEHSIKFLQTRRRMDEWRDKQLCEFEEQRKSHQPTASNSPRFEPPSSARNWQDGQPLSSSSSSGQGQGQQVSSVSASASASPSLPTPVVTAQSPYGASSSSHSSSDSSYRIGIDDEAETLCDTSSNSISMKTIPLNHAANLPPR